jgi:hypothetical protein
MSLLTYVFPQNAERSSSTRTRRQQPGNNNIAIL